MDERMERWRDEKFGLEDAAAAMSHFVPLYYCITGIASNVPVVGET